MRVGMVMGMGTDAGTDLGYPHLAVLLPLLQ